MKKRLRLLALTVALAAAAGSAVASPDVARAETQCPECYRWQSGYSVEIGNTRVPVSGDFPPYARPTAEHFDYTGWTTKYWDMRVTWSPPMRQPGSEGIRVRNLSYKKSSIFGVRWYEHVGNWVKLSDTNPDTDSWEGWAPWNVRDDEGLCGVEVQWNQYVGGFVWENPWEWGNNAHAHVRLDVSPPAATLDVRDAATGNTAWTRGSVLAHYTITDNDSEVDPTPKNGINSVAGLFTAVLQPPYTVIYEDTETSKPGRSNPVLSGDKALSDGGSLANGETFTVTLQAWDFLAQRRIFTDTIRIDRAKPYGSMSLTEVSPSDPYVNVISNVSDTHSGVWEMRLSNDGVWWGDWMQYDAMALWSVTPGHGTKTVHAQYRDHVGNVLALNSSIEQPNTPPQAVDDGPYFIHEDHSLLVPADQGVLANDYDIDGDYPLVASLASGTTFGTVLLNSDGSFSYTPSANFYGSDSFDYTVSDTDGGTDVETVLISVLPVNDPPVARDDTYACDEDGWLGFPASQGVLANDTDVDGNVLAATLETGPDHGYLFFLSDGRFFYYPYANYNGPDSFTYTVYDGQYSPGGVVTIAVNPVNDAPVVSAYGPYAVCEGGNVTLWADGADVDGDTLSYAWDLDDDGSYETSGQSVLFSGTDGPASKAVRVRVTDGNGGEATGSAVVTVENLPPAVAPGATGVTVAEGGTAQMGGTFSDAGDDTVAITCDTGAITQDDATGTWSWSAPAPDGDATHRVTVRATDSDGAWVESFFDVVVRNVEPDVTDWDFFGPGSDPFEGQVASFGGTFTDPGADDTHTATVHWGDGTPDTEATITESGGSGTVAASHTFPDNDTYTVTLTVTDKDGGTGTCETLVTVLNVDPTLSSAESTATVDEGGVAAMTGTFDDVAADMDSMELTSSVGEVVKTGDGTWSWSTPAPDGPEVYTVKVRATDKDGGWVESFFDVVVRNVEPDVTDWDFFGPGSDPFEGQVASFGGTFTDPGADDTHTATVHWGDGTPDTEATITESGGSGTVAASHTFPDNDTYTVTLTVTDDDGGVGTDTLTVTVANVAPTALDNSYEVDEDGILMTAAPGVLGNDSDVLGDPLSAAKTTDPAHGSLTLNADGSFTYTPAADYNGSDSFKYSASDDDGGSTEATVSLTIHSVNDVPAGADKTVTTDEDVTYELKTSDFGFTDPNDDPDDAFAGVFVDALPGLGVLKVDGTSIAAGDFVTAADITAAKLVFTPAQDENGDAYAAFDFRVKDDGGTDRDGADTDLSANTITIDVTAVNDAPEIVSVKPKTQTVQYSDSIAPMEVVARDIDSPVLAISGTLPNALAYGTAQQSEWTRERIGAGVTATFTVAGRASEQSGTCDITFTVSDGDGMTDADSATLVVEREEAMVTFDPDSPASVKVTAPGSDASVPCTLTAWLSELPDDSEVGTLSLAVITSVQFESVGPGGTYYGTPSAVGDDGMFTVGVPGGMPVNTYIVKVYVGGSHYEGYGEDGFTVYDPTLGFTTGGGWFYWPGTASADGSYKGDRTNYGFTMKYNRKGSNVQGTTLLIRHLPDGQILRLKSNALDTSLALGMGKDALDNPFGWASWSGKATYLDSRTMLDPAGNYSFTAYVEDWNEPGTLVDKIWFETKDKDGSVVPELSMTRPGSGNACAIKGGNIVVPHGAK